LRSREHDRTRRFGNEQRAGFDKRLVRDDDPHRGLESDAADEVREPLASSELCGGDSTRSSSYRHHHDPGDHDHADHANHTDDVGAYGTNRGAEHRFDDDVLAGAYHDRSPRVDDDRSPGTDDDHDESADDHDDGSGGARREHGVPNGHA
jgi:hypothetical protein